MKYGITKLVAGFEGFIDISEAEYIQIREARKNLFEVLFLEEKIDLVTENYYEYETELLSIASRAVIFRNENYFSISEKRSIVGRRIINLLTACRMYLDQCEHHINNIYGDNSIILSEIKKEKSQKYDQIFGYRVMEALRNYVQHRGHPIQGMVIAYNRVDYKNEIRLLHTIVPYINVAILEDDEKFKKSILKEMKLVQSKDEIDVRPLIRDYIEAIGTIHEKIRSLTKTDLKNWEMILNKVIRKFQKKYGKDVYLGGLAIVKENENGRREEKQEIFTEFVERIRDLEHKNISFNNLHIAHASNEIRDEK